MATHSVFLPEESWQATIHGVAKSLKLNHQYSGHLMGTDSLEKTLMLGKIEGRRRQR